MKLARVEHIRCSDLSATTYVWVPDEWAQEDLRVAVRKAEKAYEEVVNTYKEDVAPNNAGAWSRPDFTAHPEKTVEEVTAIHEEQKKVYREWNDKRNQAMKKFSWYLEQEGCLNFYDVHPDFTVVIDWGHNHGVPIKYEDTDPLGQDLSGPVEVKYDY